MTRILIIEDDPKYRSVLRKNLEPLGYVVFEAGDGDEGLKCLASNLPEVVLVDLLMPNKEGIETIREIRTTYPTVRIIAMSGGGQSRAIDFLNVAKKLGGDAVLAKPFRIADLLALIQPRAGIAEL